MPALPLTWERSDPMTEFTPRMAEGAGCWLSDASRGRAAAGASGLVGARGHLTESAAHWAGWGPAPAQNQQGRVVPELAESVGGLALQLLGTPLASGSWLWGRRAGR